MPSGRSSEASATRNSRPVLPVTQRKSASSSCYTLCSAVVSIRSKVWTSVSTGCRSARLNGGSPRHRAGLPAPEPGAGAAHRVLPPAPAGGTPGACSARRQRTGPTAARAHAAAATWRLRLADSQTRRDRDPSSARSASQAPCWWRQASPASADHPGPRPTLLRGARARGDTIAPHAWPAPSGPGGRDGLGWVAPGAGHDSGRTPLRGYGPEPSRAAARPARATGPAARHPEPSSHRSPMRRESERGGT